LESKPEISGRRWLWLAVPSLILIAVLSWFGLEEKQPSIAFGEWDWVLITRFDNRTGEDVLNGTVEYALQRELANSRYVKVAPPARINSALALMRLPPDTPLDIETGREISLRDGGIRMLIAGRVERIGNTYQVTSQLVNPADGVMLASFSASSNTLDEILPLVTELARDVRGALGESLSSIQESSEMLVKVTTPSLAALQLYSEADRIMRGPERQRAISVLDQALRIDPDFASAHLLLAYVLRDADQMERFRRHLQRAVELAEQSSERERLFILATYYGYLQDMDREIETYELLVRLYPDHGWANGNLGHLYSFTGRLEESYNFRVRNAELAPNDFSSQYQAALHAAIVGNKLVFNQFVDLARPLAGRNPWTNALVDLLPAHSSWVQGDFAGATAQVEELITNMPAEVLVANGPLYAQVRSLYLALGQFDRLAELSDLRPALGWFQVMLDQANGDDQTLDRYLDGELRGFWDAALAALGGRTDLARELIEDPRAVDNLPPPFLERDWRNFAVGHLAFAEKRYEEAIELLSTDRELLFFSALHAHQLAMHTLARAQLAMGQTEEAISILDFGRPHKPLTIATPGATFLWLRNQVLLFEIYRNEGKYAEAESVAKKLREMLRDSDPGHPFLLALDS
jgi:tetratricopeptide (TPR) repeat protein